MQNKSDLTLRLQTSLFNDTLSILVYHSKISTVDAKHDHNEKSQTTGINLNKITIHISMNADNKQNPLHTVPNSSMSIPQGRQSFPRTIPQVIGISFPQLDLAFVHMEEEYGQIEEDNYKKRQDEDHSQRRENPDQILQETEEVLELPEPCPFLPHMN